MRHHRVLPLLEHVGVPDTLEACAWQRGLGGGDVADKRYLSEGSMATLITPAANTKGVATPALLTA